MAARGAVDVDALDDVRQRIVGGALRGALVRGADPAPATATAASLINTTDDGAVDVLFGSRRTRRRGRSGDSPVAVARRRRGVQERRLLSDFDTS